MSYPGKPSLRARRPSSRDAAIVIVCAVATAVLASAVELNEHVFRLTRRLELLQLDELPYVLIVLSIGLGWLALRRHRRLQAEIDAHVATEARLQSAIAENRRLAAGRLHDIEAERKRLARDLHDELGQYLSLIRLDALQIDAGATTTDPEHKTSILRNVEHLQRTVRSLMSELRPVALDDLGLSAALEHGIAMWRDRAAALRFTLELAGPVDEVPEDTALAAYRIIQEGLTNAVRHAGGSRVSLDVTATRRADRTRCELQIRIEDDGKGFAGEPAMSAQGIRGMRERVELAEGSLDIESPQSGGTVVSVRLPYADPR